VHSIASAEEMQHVARSAYMPVLVKTGRQFRSRLVQRSLGDTAAITDALGGRLWTSRLPARVDTPQDDLVMFCLHKAGTGTLLQHGRSVPLGSGVGVLYEARSPWEMTFPGSTRALTFQFPRHLMPLTARELSAVAARGVDLASPAGRLVVDFLAGLHAMTGLSPEQAQDARQAAVEMVSMLLRGARPASPGGAGADAVLLSSVRRYIRDHLHDPKLTVEELARVHHLSVRRLYAVFEGSGTTPAAAIREQRLHAAERLLADPRHAHRPVADIAAAVGFAELRTFERAFRRGHDASPGSWRAAPPAADGSAATGER
jgi:AraC-like DNA-binding protein